MLCRSEDNKNATENAVSSLGKVLQYQPGTQDGEQLGELWVTSLPLTSDKAEAKAVHAQLVYFLDQSDSRYIPLDPACQALLPPVCLSSEI